MSMRVRVLQRHSLHHHVGLVRLRRLRRTYTASPVRGVTLDTVSATSPAPGAKSQWASHESWLWTALGAVICAAIFGSAYWTQSYDDLDIGSIGLPLYLIACLPVIALRATRTAPYVMASLALPTGLVFAVIGRIAVDVASDPTSHNLWPIEIVIAGVVGLFWGFLAGGVGELILRGRQSRR